MSLDRRNYLKLMGGSVAGFYGFALLGGCELLAEKIRNRPLRRNIASLANNDPIIQAYRTGVAAMKALPDSDGRNWNRQAKIHADFCPHGNWYFLPWHRAYLYYFESIVRELSGYQDFALPYWNWTCGPRIPAPFFEIPELVDSTRRAGPSDTVPSSIAGENVLRSILGIADFETFGSSQSTELRERVAYGELEGAPHNSIHGWVGGNMGSVPIAARDPIFWCHHNMIERCWWDWNITQGKPNPGSSNWTGMPLNNMFFDKDGNPVTNLTVATTALMPLLSYQFDDQLLPCGSQGTLKAAASAHQGQELRKFLEKGGPARLNVLERVSVELPKTLLVKGRAPEVIPLPKNTTRMLLSKRETQRIVLSIEDARQLQGQDVFTRVYINPPANLDLHSVDSIHYAGSFAFFGDADHQGGQDHGSTYYIDVTDTVEALLRAGAISEDTPLNIQLTAVSISDGQSIPRGHIALSGIEMLLSEGFEKR